MTSTRSSGPFLHRAGRLAVLTLLVASLGTGAAGLGAAAPASASASDPGATSGSTSGSASGPASTSAPARATSARLARVSPRPQAAAAQFLGSPTTLTPDAPDFPAWLDAPPAYEPETSCSPTATPGALDVVRILTATYGPGYATNVVRGCSAAKSGHEEGRAVDWMTDVRVPAQKADADSFVRWLLADGPDGRRDVMARRLGVMYLIWDSRFYPVYAARPAWSEYRDCLTARTGPASDTTCHRDHVHLSLAWAGARRETSWWTLADGLGACTARSVPSVPLPPAGDVVTAVTRTTVLDTAQGVGTPRVPLPCAVEPGGRIAVRATGIGPVPATAAALTVEVVASGARRATWVSVTYGGGPRSGARLDVAAGATARRTLTVPVGRTGGLSVDVGPGAADVRLDVLGYVPAEASGERRPVVLDGTGGGRVGA